MMNLVMIQSVERVVQKVITIWGKYWDLMKMNMFGE